MANESKNRVKVAKKYTKIGVIPVSALKRINNHFSVPYDARTIRANVGNTIKHNNKHFSGMKRALDELGITKEGYAEYVARNYTEIRTGNKTNSLVLVVRTNASHHMATIHLFFDKNENFWLVTSVHPEREEDLTKNTLLWSRE